MAAGKGTRVGTILFSDLKSARSSEGASLYTGMRTQALPGSDCCSPARASVFTPVPGVGVTPASCPAPALPTFSAAGTASLYIMLTVEITSRLLFYTAPRQNSPRPSDQDKLNTILAVSIFIPFYKRGWMGGRDPLRCQPSKAPEGCPPHSGLPSLSLSPPPFWTFHNRLKLNFSLSAENGTNH